MDLNKMMKQAQRMQSDMAKAKSEIEALRRSYTAGGVVEATVRGDNTLESINIAPSAIDPEDAEGLEDLVLTAVNGALEEIHKAAEDRMKQATGGMALPGM